MPFANFNESQLIDAGGGNFGIKLNLPAEAQFADLGMTATGGKWTLPHYNTNQPITDGADYWLIVRPSGQCFGLGVNEIDVHNLGSFGNFKKQDGVAFVTPHNEAWPTSSFGYIYAKR